MDNYNLKEKINVTEEFVSELIKKSWQEAEQIQQQVSNLDTETVYGKEVHRLLKNLCTSYYVLIGCLENLGEPRQDLADEVETVTAPVIQKKDEPVHDEFTLNANSDFEPFEYFVDFDEPAGDPITDKDLYGNE